MSFVPYLHCIQSTPSPKQEDNEECQQSSSTSLVKFESSPTQIRKFISSLTLLSASRTLLSAVLTSVLAGKLDPSLVFDVTDDLDGVPAGYAAMDSREALKVLVKL